MSKKIEIMLSEWSERNQARHNLVVRIIQSHGDFHNLGSICLGREKAYGPCNDCIHLDLAHDFKEISVPYLIGEITNQGGDFRGSPANEKDGACRVGSGPKSNDPEKWPKRGERSFRTSLNDPEGTNHPRGNSACWNGVIYESWRAYRDPEHAVAYLKRYFDVVADGFNQTYTQQWINACAPLSEERLAELGEHPCSDTKSNSTARRLEIIPLPPVGNPPAKLPAGFGRADILKELVRWIHEEPFQRCRRYAGNIAPVSAAPVVAGWENRIKEYAYAKQNGPHFTQVYKDTLPMIGAIASLRGTLTKNAPPPASVQQALSRIAENICLWGGVRQRSYVDAWKVVRDAIFATDNGSQMNSGWTKVASFATDGMSGNEQTIWDSRVATSIIWRIDQIIGQALNNGNITAAEAQGIVGQFNLGTVSSLSVGTRPRALKFKWPNGYASWSFHFSGSQVVREIVDILNHPGNGYPAMPKPTFDARYNQTGLIHSPWTVFGVGLVLFMDGW